MSGNSDLVFQSSYDKFQTRGPLPGGGGGGCTPSFGLCWDVPLDRVWCFGLAVLKHAWYTI